MNESEGFKIDVGVDTEATESDFKSLTAQAQKLTQRLSSGFQSTFANVSKNFLGDFRKGWDSMSKLEMPKMGISMPKGGKGIPNMAAAAVMPRVSFDAGGITKAMKSIVSFGKGVVGAGLLVGGFAAATAIGTASVIKFANSFKDTHAIASIAGEFSRFEWALRGFKNTFVSGFVDMIAPFKLFDFFANQINRVTERLSFFYAVMTEALSVFTPLVNIADTIIKTAFQGVDFFGKVLATATMALAAFANVLVTSVRMLFAIIKPGGSREWGKILEDASGRQQRLFKNMYDIWANPKRFQTNARDATGAMRYAAFGSFSAAEAQSLSTDIQQQQMGELRSIRMILERISQMNPAVII